MPVRIKPIRDLGPCTLSLESISGICELMGREFGEVSFAAEDGTWVVFNEPGASFLQLIGTRDKLDTFTAEAPPLDMESGIRIHAASIENLVIGADQSLISLPTTTISGADPSTDEDVNEKRVRLVFSEKEAKVVFDIPPDAEDWLEHFMLDLNKHILPPSLLQRFGGIPIPLVIIQGAFVIPIGQPYCRIILKQSQVNQRLIGIGDNVAANIVYDVLKYVIFFLAGALALWLWDRYGIRLPGTNP